MPITDTNALNTKFDNILNDFSFFDEDGALPCIVDNIDDFIGRYIEYCREISMGRREKIKALMNTQAVTSENCHRMLAEKLNQMMDKCDKELDDNNRTILKWDRNSDSENDFSSVPKESTVRKWLSDTGARNPSRMYLYKIAFALGLKAYYPNEISDAQSDEYKTSVNYLFNKIYNQRYCTRSYHELIFVFCLKNGKDYLTAMKMIAQYIKTPKTDTIDLSDSDNNTLYIINYGLSGNENDFVRFLVQITPFLNDRYSSVFSQIEENIEYFSGDDVMQEFFEKYTQTSKMNSMLISYDPDFEDEKYDFSVENSYVNDYKSYMNMGKKVLVNNTVKKYMELLDDRMRISSAVYEYDIDSSDKESVFPEFRRLGISEKLYDYIIGTASESISAKFGKGSHEYFSDIIKDVILTEDDIYNPGFIKRKENCGGTYDWEVKKIGSISHNLLYKDLRNSLITAHFFCYWSSDDSELSYDGYIKEINQILGDSFYQKLSVKNSFDCFFMLCARTDEPIDSYYGIVNYILSFYNDYQKGFALSEAADEFSEYEEYTSDNKYAIDSSYTREKLLPIVSSECLHPIDDTKIQEKLLKIIKNYSNSRCNGDMS